MDFARNIRGRGLSTEGKQNKFTKLTVTNLKLFQTSEEISQCTEIEKYKIVQSKFWKLHFSIFMVVCRIMLPRIPNFVGYV